jgi:acetyl esterase/lipase/L-ascorbate metabolism protein UlaG (beta-lactamase superfamily)
VQADVGSGDGPMGRPCPVAQVRAAVKARAGDGSPAGIATWGWRSGSVRGQWVAVAGGDSHAAALYLHGCRFFQDREPAGLFAVPLARALRMPVLMLDYRLAPADPYPAALHDVLAAYRALVGQQGLSAEQIVLVGHSAGATLALSALLELAAAGDPRPAAAVSISPASPLFGDPTALPPLLIACGGDEVLRDDSARFAARANGAGVPVQLDVYDGMPHGFPLLPTRTAQAVLDRIAEFVHRRLRGGPPGPMARPLTIRRVGWAGYEITTEQGTTVLVDPYQSGTEGMHSGLPESPITAEELVGADVVAVTHAGYDHRGQSVPIALAGDSLLVCGAALYQDALSQGFPPDRAAPMVSGVEFRHRDVTLKALPARHDSSMRSEGQFISDQPLSFLLTTAAGSRIFCGGDFSLSADLRTWAELYRPEVAVLGIGGVSIGPVSTTELPPREAAVAASWLGVGTVIPVHYPPGDPAPVQLIAELSTQDPDVEVAVLDYGDTWTAGTVSDSPLRRLGSAARR